MAAGAGNEAPTKTYLAVKLSNKEAKKEALQRAVSRMLKADWVVMADLWIDDKNGNGELERTDEFGPEGDALWTKLLNGVGLFEAVAKAASARNDFLDDNNQGPDFVDNVTVYKEELERLNKELAASVALIKLMEYRWAPEQQGTNPSTAVVPDGIFPDEDDAVDGEKVGAAIARLRAQYEFLDKAWAGLNEAKETDRNEIFAALKAKRGSKQSDVTAHEDERERELQGWRDANAALQEATLRYNNMFPQEE